MLLKPEVKAFERVLVTTFFSDPVCERFWDNIDLRVRQTQRIQKKGKYIRTGLQKPTRFPLKLRGSVEDSADAVPVT